MLLLTLRFVLAKISNQPQWGAISDAQCGNLIAIYAEIEEQQKTFVSINRLKVWWPKLILF